MVCFESDIFNIAYLDKLKSVQYISCYIPKIVLRFKYMIFLLQYDISQYIQSLYLVYLRDFVFADKKKLKKFEYK